jgi:hypothetical protein
MKLIFFKNKKVFHIHYPILPFKYGQVSWCKRTHNGKVVPNWEVLKRENKHNLCKDCLHMLLFWSALRGIPDK